MATGFCPALLTTVEAVAEQNAPSRKLSLAGFLSMLLCCQNSSVSPLNDAYEDGYIKPVYVRYRQRPTIDQVQDEDDCDVNRLPTYNEWAIPTLGHKQHAFLIPDSLMRQYCKETPPTRTIGTPATRVMQEVYDLILESANIVLKAINRDLIGDMATQFGENVSTGSTAPKIININETPTVDLENGIVDLLHDFIKNEICGTPCIVGAGNFAAWTKAKLVACCNSAGIDISKFDDFKFFYDKDTQNLWGANGIGVFAPGSVKFVALNSYVNEWGGQKGASEFLTFPLPVNEFGCNVDDCLSDLQFDLQLKYYDCPTTITVNGAPYNAPRGWVGIISKKYALWVQPTNAYASGDDLEGTNGTLRYFVTNTTNGNASYGYPY